MEALICQDSTNDPFLESKNSKVFDKRHVAYFTDLFFFFLVAWFWKKKCCSFFFLHFMKTCFNKWDARKSVWPTLEASNTHIHPTLNVGHTCNFICIFYLQPTHFIHILNPISGTFAGEICIDCQPASKMYKGLLYADVLLEYIHILEFLKLVTYGGAEFCGEDHRVTQGRTEVIVTVMHKTYYYLISFSGHCRREHRHMMNLWTNITTIHSFLYCTC